MLVLCRKEEGSKSRVQKGNKIFDDIKLVESCIIRIKLEVSGLFWHLFQRQ